MNDDLISRKAFYEFVDENCNDELADLWKELIRRQPTVFDKEKVIKDLQFLTQDAIRHEKHDFAEAYELAIEVVEKGGVA